MNSVWKTFFDWSILVLTFASLAEGKGHFSYEDQDLWHVDYPSCSGKQQSPIKIKSSLAIVNEALTLHLQKYDEEFYNRVYYWINDGHTLKLVKNDIADTHIVAGRAVDNGQYKFRQLHMHWGQRNDYGSEHSVDGIKYPLEMHLVHESLDINPQSNKLAVLALFFVVGKEHPFLKELVQSIHELSIVNKSFAVRAQSDARGIVDVLPMNLESYFLYNGSLTTPGCDETVRWIVFKEIQEISEEQLNAIRSTFTFQTNSRMAQQLNERKVYTSNSLPMEKNPPNLPSCSRSSLISNRAFNAFMFLLSILSKFV